jgi:hypothetical protein
VTIPWTTAYYSSLGPEGSRSHWAVKDGDKTILRTVNEVATDEDERRAKLAAMAPTLLHHAKEFIADFQAYINSDDYDLPDPTLLEDTIKQVEAKS